MYFTLNYEVIIILGLTELKAQVAWLDRNVRISFTFDSLLIVLIIDNVRL